MKKVIVKQTKVSGSGRRTMYSEVPTFGEVEKLRALGYDADFINIAPRGGAWGHTIQVPSRQAEKAKRVLAGERLFASRQAKRAAKAREKAREEAAAEVEENVISKNHVGVVCDVASVAVEADNFTIIDVSNVDLPSQYRPDYWGSNCYWIKNDYGDGDMTLSLVKVKDCERRFSRHEAFGDTPPPLRAEAKGPIKVFFHDCRKDHWFEVFAKKPVRFYSQNKRVYMVGEDFTVSMPDPSPDDQRFEEELDEIYEELVNVFLRTYKDPTPLNGDTNGH